MQVIFSLGIRQDVKNFGDQVQGRISKGCGWKVNLLGSPIVLTTNLTLGYHLQAFLRLRWWFQVSIVCGAKWKDPHILGWIWAINPKLFFKWVLNPRPHPPFHHHGCQLSYSSLAKTLNKIYATFGHFSKITILIPTPFQTKTLNLINILA